MAISDEEFKRRCDRLFVVSGLIVLALLVITPLVRDSGRDVADGGGLTPSVMDVRPSVEQGLTLDEVEGATVLETLPNHPLARDAALIHKMDPLHSMLLAFGLVAIVTIVMIGIFVVIPRTVP